jgi:hypothetical protein
MASKTKTFILSWDCYGLECCRELGKKMDQAMERDKEIVLELLKDPDQNYDNTPMREINQLVNILMLRARTNSQRSYEIYTVSTDASQTEESLTQAFSSNPQGMSELIRSRGLKIYSDYRPSHTDFRNEKNTR